MKKEFSGRRSVFIGGTKGIGYAGALELAKRGLSEIVLVGIEEDLAKTSSEQIQSETGCKAYPFVADISKPEDIENLFEYAKDKLETIDILVNNAGVAIPVELEDEDAEAWDHVMNINVRGFHLCVREVIPQMIKQRYGKIINISSLSSRLGSIVSGVAYAASKGAVNSITYTYAKRYGKYNINVNAILPGLIRTPLTDTLDYTGTGFSDDDLKNYPLGRAGTPEDIATVICFLASEDSKYITGCTIDVNGGVFML